VIGCWLCVPASCQAL